MAAHPLENCVYRALTGEQRGLALTEGQAARFNPEFTALGGLRADTPEAFKDLAALVPSGKTVGIMADRVPGALAGFGILHDIPLIRMVYAPGNVDVESVDFAELGAADNPAMRELAELTKPGPFAARTHELGRYVGLRAGGRLVAMAGERLRLPGYTEVSAICTHPDYTGRGYARKLTKLIIAGILERGQIPFLHSRAENPPAIKLYERLGFQTVYEGRYLILQRAYKAK